MHITCILFLLLLYNIVTLRLIYVVRISNLFLLVAEQCLVVWIYQFVYMLVDIWAIYSFLAVE